MKLYAICQVKNEDDIIAETLTYATRFCDKVFVLDNGSTDTTWRIVQDLARAQPSIVPFEQTFRPYSDALRAMVYNEIHRELSDDDWWMILDSDEFITENPKALIQEAKRDSGLTQAELLPQRGTVAIHSVGRCLLLSQDGTLHVAGKVSRRDAPTSSRPGRGSGAGELAAKAGTGQHSRNYGPGFFLTKSPCVEFCSCSSG